jgi:hypothetical protein
MAPLVKSEDITRDIREHVDMLIETYFLGTEELTSSSLWSQLACMSLNANPSMDQVFVANTLCDKQRDYGPENIARFSHKGLILRLHDKVARLENLLASGASAKNEALEDTYMDIIGYSVIGMMLLDGSFFFPMGDE